MSSKNEAICSKLYMNGSQFCWCASGCNHHMSGLHLTVSKEWISASKRNARRRSLLLSTWNESKEKSRPAARQIPLTQLTIFAAEGFYFIFSLNWGLFFKTSSAQDTLKVTAAQSVSGFSPDLFLYYCGIIHIWVSSKVWKKERTGSAHLAHCMGPWCFWVYFFLLQCSFNSLSII